jgi:hypothetical protein
MSRLDVRLLKRIRLGRRRPVAAKREVMAEIRTLRGRLPHVTGVLVATVDGLLVAHETRDVEPDVLAAMSAAQLGLGQQIARGASQGEFLETVTRTAGGYLAVFAAGADALLTVLSGAELNIGRLHHEARPAAARIGALLAAVPGPGGRGA